jgi:hypothetical protein
MDQKILADGYGRRAIENPGRFQEFFGQKFAWINPFEGVI